MITDVLHFGLNQLILAYSIMITDILHFGLRRLGVISRVAPEQLPPLHLILTEPEEHLDL
jgi:hypothetical protein